MIFFGQIVGADHEMSHNVAERGEHQKSATSEQVDRVGAQTRETSEAKVDF